MHIGLVGINYKTAPVAIRELAAVRSAKLPESLSLLQSCIPWGVILSTCNRTEVYTADGDASRAEAASLEFLKSHLGVSGADLRQYAYIARDEAAVTHLFRIACGLDSMVVGEFEVLGQVGQALAAAEKAGMTSLPLRHIFHGAVRTGRRVREETEISRNALSVSSVAVDLITGVVKDLENCRVMVIGAGEAGRLAARTVRERGVSRIIIASRTRERAAELAAAVGGTPIDLSDLVAELGTCDVVFTCADAPHWILEAGQVASAMSRRPGVPLAIIDIAVPRNVEPAVEQIDNVFLYNIDNLNDIAGANRQHRERGMKKAEEIIEGEVSRFASWRRAYEVRPVLSALMQKAEDIRQVQLSRTLKKLRPLSDEERENLEAMTRSIVTKILQDPVRCLKENTTSNGHYADMVSELFQLDEERQV
ncbi:MAG: glutamyl-tRNA reductase [Chloroflexota bacterium]